jgi:DNA repair protein RAD5
VKVKEKEDTVEPDDNNGQVDIDSLISQFTGGTEEDDEGPSAVYAEDVLKKLDEADGQECAVCLDIMDQPVLVPNCLHSG